jgi:CsoR family transcriptional regulator, copper-sensing transcriptional repressor
MTTQAPTRPMDAEHEAEILDRLRRVEGQVSGIRKMYEDGRYCIDILDQLSAARSAIKALALLVLEDHVNSCVRDAIDGGEAEAKTAEMLSAVRRFVRSM